MADTLTSLLDFGGNLIDKLVYSPAEQRADQLKAQEIQAQQYAAEQTAAAAQENAQAAALQLQAQKEAAADRQRAIMTYVGIGVAALVLLGLLYLLLTRFGG